MKGSLSVEITPEELNALVIKSYADAGHALPPDIDVSVTICKVVDDLKPLPIQSPKPGYSLSSEFPTDPKFFVNTVATVFGSNYNGGKDPEDEGQGAFKDPTTGQYYATRDVIGVSIPIPMFRAMINDYQAVSEKKYTVRIINPLKPDHAMSNVPIVDLGPGKDGKLLDGRYLDRTLPLCRAMGDLDNTRVHFCIIGPDGKPMEIKGLDGPKIAL